MWFVVIAFHYPSAVVRCAHQLSHNKRYLLEMALGDPAEVLREDRRDSRSLGSGLRRVKNDKCIV